MQGLQLLVLGVLVDASFLECGREICDLLQSERILSLKRNAACVGTGVEGSQLGGETGRALGELLAQSLFLSQRGLKALELAVLQCSSKVVLEDTERLSYREYLS